MMYKRLRPRLKFGLVALLTLFGALFGGASRAAPTKPRDPFDLDVVRYQLPSGMTVLLHRDTTLPQVVVSLWFDVGSRDERPGRTGFAHLYEHLMFMGTKHVPNGGFDQTMEAEGGHNNASTSTDRTFYFDVGPSHLLGTLLWLEAERLTTLPLAMTDEKVALQREVVRNERRQSYENRPYGRAELLINEAMYPKGHPYSWPVIGSHADLVAASTDDVKQFFYRYYVPSNATLAIAGDFDPAEARRMIERYFGWMPKVPRPAPPPVPPPLTAPVTRSLTIPDKVELARAYLIWHAPPAETLAFAETQLLADVLGHGKSSRLYKALVREQQIASTVEVGIEPQSYGSLLIAELTGRPGVKPEALVAAAEAELNRLAREPLPEVELVRARNQRLTDWAHEIETLLGRSQALQQGQALRDDPRSLAGLVAHLRGLTPAALRERARGLRLFDANARLTLQVVPAPKEVAKADAKPEAKIDAKPEGKPEAKIEAKTDAKAAAAAPKPEVPPPGSLAEKAPAQLATAPKLPAPRPFVAPKAARFRIGDLDAVLVQRRGAALLETVVVLRDGAGSVPAAQAGLPQAVAALITEGAGARDAATLADDLERLGALLKAEVRPDSTQVRLSVMAERFGEAAPILSDVLARPRLDPKEWQRVQAERLAEIVKARAEPRQVAERAAYAALFGEAHPYGLAPLGREATVKALTIADLRAFHAAAYQPRRATIVIAGDIELNQAAAAQLLAPLADWKNPQAAAAPAALPPPRTPERRLVLVDRPGASQTELRVIAPGLPRRSKDTAVADVMDIILGGSFTSRLNQNLRERHGYTYGAASRLLPFDGAGLFSAGAAVRTDVTAESLTELLGELERMRTEAIAADELAKGKKSVQQHLVAECERAAGLAHVFAEIARGDLPLDELTRLLNGARAATTGAIQKTAGGLLAPPRLSIVVVGDLKKVEAAVRKQLGAGPSFTVERRDSDGQPLPQ